MYIEKVVYESECKDLAEYDILKHNLGMIFRDDLMNVDTVTADDIKAVLRYIKDGEIEGYTTQQAREAFYACFGTDVYKALMRGRIDRVYIV